MEHARKLQWDTEFEGAPRARPQREAEDPFAGLDKVIRLALTPKGREQEDGEPRRRDRGGPAPFQAGALTQRDWSAALDLVRQASDAIRVTEARNQEMEARIQGLMRRAAQELEAAEARVEAAEGRARDAEARAEEAEAWLKRLHEAITDGFHPARVEKRARPAPTA